MKLYRALASMVHARINCEGTGNDEWRAKHSERIVALVREHMPSGSGFDSGTTLDFDASTPEKLVFVTAFHHMSETGYYCGWSEHRVTVRASLESGFYSVVSGRDRNDIKQFIGETFDYALCTEVQA